MEYQPVTLSISQGSYLDWKSYHLETVLINVLDSGGARTDNSGGNYANMKGRKNLLGR
ncbi:hypothetical protein CIPOMM044M_16860 [Citrobacter portucalensis]